MMKRVIFAFPGELDTPTGGYIYDRRIIAGLQRLGWQVDLLSLGPGFPYPSQHTRNEAAELLQAVTPGTLIVMDGLAAGVLPEAIAACAQTHPVIALVHHPLAYEAGLSLDQAQAFLKSETQALRHVTHVIVTGPSTARDLTQSFGVDPHSVEVVCPGTARAPQALGSGSDTIELLSVGSVIPRKGFDVLLAALQPLADLPWRLSIAGDLSRDDRAPLQLKQDIDRFGFESRVHPLGVVDDTQLEALYRTADVFVLASLFEGYGMAYAEALARGLPVIGTTGGAIPDTVPSGAGLLVPPGDVQSLTQALRSVIEDPALRAKLSQGARKAAALQPTWEESAARFGEILSRHAILTR
jgi:glycosyltransferase involved in cell wall biosynthesis